MLHHFLGNSDNPDEAEIPPDPHSTPLKGGHSTQFGAHPPTAFSRADVHIHTY
jgi:hypothetical protein